MRQRGLRVQNFGQALTARVPKGLHREPRRKGPESRKGGPGVERSIGCKGRTAGHAVQDTFIFTLFTSGKLGKREYAQK